MDVSLVQSFHLLVELKTFQAHRSQRLFVDAYTPSALCGRNWVRGNRHLFLFYSKRSLLSSPRSSRHSDAGSTPRYQHVIPSARATDITEVPLGIVSFLEIEEKYRCTWMPRIESAHEALKQQTRLGQCLQEFATAAGHGSRSSGCSGSGAAKDSHCPYRGQTRTWDP